MTYADARSPPARTGLRALARLWPFMRPYGVTLVAAVGALVVAAAASLALPVGVRFVIDEGFLSDGRGDIDDHFVILFAMAAVLAVFSEGGDFYCLAKDGGDTARRPVKLGATNGTMVEITEGLRPGENVALWDPSED